MQLLIIKRRGAGSQFLLSNYPATAHMPGMGAKAGAPHAPIPNGGDVGMPKADEYKSPLPFKRRKSSEEAGIAPAMITRAGCARGRVI